VILIVNLWYISRGSSASFGIPAREDPSDAPNGVDALDSYALERWEVSEPTDRLPGS
jgi:hypothetical protein